MNLNGMSADSLRLHSHSQKQVHDALCIAEYAGSAALTSKSAFRICMYCRW